MNDHEYRKRSSEWVKILNDLGDLIDRSWKLSRQEIGTTTDPRMVSIQIFRRLKGHRNAFALLFNDNLNIDADIACRSAIEASICLINLNSRREDFVRDLRSDAAFTINGQIQIWFELGSDDQKKASEEMPKIFGARRDDGEKHTPLRWKSLADQAGLPELYRWYKNLSGGSVHVTGLSLTMDTLPLGVDGLESKVQDIRYIREINSLAMACGAAQIGCSAHANTLGYEEIEQESDAILIRMGKIDMA